MKHLFVDNENIEAIDNLARKLHQPEKFENNVVIRPDHRWENRGIQVRTTPVWLPDEGVFKLIYHTIAESTEPVVAGRDVVASAVYDTDSYACYAVSSDGINWEKPFLGLHDYAGGDWHGRPIGKNNNIVPSAGGVIQGPIYDPHDPDPKRRFKGLRLSGEGLQSMGSANLLDWQELDVPLIPSHDEAHLTYDESKRLFILMAKGGGPYGRSWHLSTSEDFAQWTHHGLVFHADQVDQENGRDRLQRFFDDPAYQAPIVNRPEEWRTDVYNFPVFPYEGLYLATPVMHHWAGKYPPVYENVDSRKTVELASSRDLQNWNRVADRAPFLELSPVGDGSAYDTAQILVTNCPVVRNNELWFYYLGFRYRAMTTEYARNRKYLDSSALCMARLRMDGFVSLKGGVEWGTVLTKPFTVTGRSLHINTDSWRGKVLAEVLDANDGKPIPGFTRDECRPAVINAIDETVQWKSAANLAALAGRTVRLRFHLRQAELYAYWFGDEA